MTGVAQAREHFLTFEGTTTDSESHYHALKFTLPRCHQRRSLDRDRTQMTHVLCCDHAATQLECAHRLFSLVASESEEF